MKSKAIFVSLLVLILPGGLLAHASSDKDKGHAQKTERTMATDPAVTVSLCVMSGNINVSGWDKNEVLARSSEGAQIQLRRSNDSDQSARATRVEVFVLDKDEVEQVKRSCQASGDVELKVPRGASVHIQTRDGDISITQVAMAYAGSQNGDVSIERVSRAIEVGTIAGSVCIKDSSGRMSVTSIGGGVQVTNVRPAEPGDAFEANSVSGDIQLDGVSHAQLNARTVNGNLNLLGPLAHGGSYEFNTFSGDVTLTLPADSSFKLNAKVSKDGEIITDFPLTLITERSISFSPVAPPATASAPPQSPAPAPPAPTAAPVVSSDPATPVVVVTTTPAGKTVARVKKVITVNPVVVMAPYGLRRVTAVHGTGDATIAVASFSGTLHLKQN